MSRDMSHLWTKCRHESAVAWIEALVYDAKLRLLGYAPRAPITLQRLEFWRTLRADLESCVVPDIMGHADLMEPTAFQKHWETLLYLNGLLVDLKLEAMGEEVACEITQTRLDAWTQHRRELEQCRVRTGFDMKTRQR